MEIRLARHDRYIAIVSIDNGPRLNAMTRQMLSKLGALWDKLEHDPTCRCIILTGAGQRAFTVGADISDDLSVGPEMARMVNHALLKNDAYSKPIVAAVNGDCVGGGLELLLPPIFAPRCPRRGSACPKSSGRFIRSAARRSS
jgi:enoyl-CoA hydratase/carnithine racemase